MNNMYVTDVRHQTECTAVLSTKHPLFDTTINKSLRQLKIVQLFTTTKFHFPCVYKAVTRKGEV